MEDIQVIVIDNQEVVKLYVETSQGVTKHSQLDLDDGTNPHNTTKTDVGLSNVPNTDFTTPVSVNTAKVSFPEAPIDTKQYARKDAGWEEVVSSGSTIPATKTGQTFVFTEDAFYNKATFLPSGNITLDLTDAVSGTVLTAYFDSYVPTFTVTNASNSEKYFIDSGFFSLTRKNIVSIMYNGASVSLHIANRSISTDFVTNLVASYNLNSDATDYTGNNDGVATDLTFTPAKVGNGAVFNGSSSFITIPDSDDFSMIDGSGDLPFTISFWMSFADFVTDGDIISKAELVTGNYEWVIKKATSAIQFFLYSENVISNNLRMEYEVSGLATSTLHHFIVEYNGNGTTSGYKLTVNGIDVTADCAFFENGTYVKMTNNGAALLIGKRHDNTKYLNSTLDEVHIWKDRIFTSDEKVEIYNKEYAGISIL